MTELHLKTVTRTSGANRELKEGRIDPEGAVLDFVEVPVLPQAFRRMVRDQEFDVCEMAVTTYLVAKAHGAPFTALPVFLVRGFHHGAVQVSKRAGVTAPDDLQGRRVGVNRGYTVTTGVWARGVLAEEYGVDLDRVLWVLSGDEHVPTYRPPGNVVPIPTGADLPSLLASGELAAAVGAGVDHPDVEPLIPHAREAALEALRRDGFYPINHLVVVKDELLAEHPELAGSLFSAFAEAKQRYVDELRSGAITAPTAADQTHLDVMATTGGDPLPYGIEPNRRALEKLIELAVGQHILDMRPDVDALFAAGARGLVA
ncbi:substrate-binding domain-containing protein [Streptomyces justiciae]|uniref:ABC transporter substrate-binding protein n=1 Tax=Streptomyces justiciae TaxID=2780140 RepID=UPI00211994C1|nr:ABC transporter substrate-binding protein [Streptomyces justiciae]MCW8379707.1 ABC transporter substrate-binding protein [Streptomyces justiciae]